MILCHLSSSTDMMNAYKLDPTARVAGTDLGLLIMHQEVTS